MSTDKSITSPIEKEILKSTVDLSIDYAELSLDSVLDNEVVSEIPFVKSVVGLMKIGYSIKERHNLKKLLTFFKEFHKNTVPEKDLLNFKTKFETNEKYRRKVVETILIFNDRFITEEKSKILARLIKANIENNLSWEELTDLAIALESLHPKGFKELEKLSKKKWRIDGIHTAGEEILLGSGLVEAGGNLLVREMGRKLFNYGINQE